MKRREFLGYSALVSLAATQLPLSVPAFADGKKSITEKDIFKDGMTGTPAKYCENPPAKACAEWPAATKPHCESCNLYNTDKSETDFKGKKYARCALLTDPSKPQFVARSGWCMIYSKKG